MADTKTSDETAATTPTGTELVRIVQGGSSKKTTAAVLGHQFRGCKAKMTSDDTAQNVTSETAVSFDAAAFDTDSFWSAGSPTRITIPSASFTYVSLVGQVQVSSSTADSYLICGIQHKNSANTLLRHFGARFVEKSATGVMMQASTGPVAVSSGDYFLLMVREETDNSVTIEGDDTGETFLALTVLGMAP